jgi:hypothetical protein
LRARRAGSSSFRQYPPEDPRRREGHANITVPIGSAPSRAKK